MRSRSAWCMWCKMHCRQILLQLLWPPQQFTKAFLHCRTTTVTAIRRKAVFKGLIARTERSAQRQHLYSEVNVYTPQIRSLPSPPISDFVSQDHRNLITTHYFKRLDSLIIVPTAGAVMWTALHILQLSTPCKMGKIQ